MARAERIEGQPSLPALLWRRVEVSKLTLVGPNILFEQVAGRPNWAFSPPERGGGASTALAPGSAFRPFQAENCPAWWNGCGAVAPNGLSLDITGSWPVDLRCQV